MHHGFSIIPLASGQRARSDGRRGERLPSSRQSRRATVVLLPLAEVLLEAPVGRRSLLPASVDHRPPVPFRPLIPGPWTNLRFVRVLGACGACGGPADVMSARAARPAHPTWPSGMSVDASAESGREASAGASPPGSGGEAQRGAMVTRYGQENNWRTHRTRQEGVGGLAASTEVSGCADGRTCAWEVRTKEPPRQVPLRASTDASARTHNGSHAASERRWPPRTTSRRPGAAARTRG